MNFIVTAGLFLIINDLQTGGDRVKQTGTMSQWLSFTRVLVVSYIT